jgi:hypothetical protein
LARKEDHHAAHSRHAPCPRRQALDKLQVLGLACEDNPLQVVAAIKDGAVVHGVLLADQMTTELKLWVEAVQALV